MAQVNIAAAKRGQLAAAEAAENREGQARGQARSARGETGKYGLYAPPRGLPSKTRSVFSSFDLPKQGGSDYVSSAE